MHFQVSDGAVAWSIWSAEVGVDPMTTVLLRVLADEDRGRE